MELIRIPSISAMPAHKEDTFKVLEAMRRIISPMGFDSTIIPTKGNPLLVATRKGDSREWVTIYNHLDVQPAEEPQWETEPFNPIEKNNAIYGRGATDDKGPALTIIHAIDQLQKHNQPLPNIQLVYETEEEIGSPHFGEFLDESIRKAIIQKPHSILVSDSEFEGEFPSINYKLRGMVRVFLELETGTQEAHSGVTGGVAQNPLEILSRVIVSMKDERGRILIPGYYDDVVIPSPAEKELLQKVATHMDVSKFKRETGLRALYTEDPADMLMRIWHQPTIEMHGFEGVQHVPGVIKSSIPNKVTAKITLRLVPNQTPTHAVEQIRRFVQSIHPSIRVRGDGQPPSLIPIDNPYMALARQSCVTGFGKEPVFVGAGGSIGAVAQYQRVWKDVPIVLLSQSLLSDGYHAPNENFKLGQAEKGMRTMGAYLSLIAQKKN
jgi:acetylornithine deacetylase/succinyl-diaminopimelate desuccinylase-like protein